MNRVHALEHWRKRLLLPSTLNIIDMSSIVYLVPVISISQFTAGHSSLPSRAIKARAVFH